MKRITNVWLQLVLGLVAGVIGVIVFYPLAILFYLKYAGFELFFDTGFSGDKSPITFTLAAVFIVLTFAFPTLIWLFINKHGNLKSISQGIRTTSFFLFATLPLWTYWGWMASSKIQDIYKDYRSIRDACIIKNGVNAETIGENTKEIECKNGVFNGLTRTYNSKGIIIYEGTYLNGKLNGTGISYYDDGKVKRITNYKEGNQEGIEIFYNENGSTNLYTIHAQGKTRWVYFQESEIHYEPLNLETQKYFCKNHTEPSFKYYSFSCLNNVINGEFLHYNPDGNMVERENFVNGVLDGTYEQFSGGKLFKHLEFRNGELNGIVQTYGLKGILDYEGQYTNGLQNGIFRRYDYEGNLESEVVFEQGQIVKINKLITLSQP